MSSGDRLHDHNDIAIVPGIPHGKSPAIIILLTYIQFQRGN